MSALNKAWRTVIAEPYDELYLQDNYMVLQSEEKKSKIPVEQIRELLITTSKGNISLPLLIKLTEQNSMVWLCDYKRFPICEISPINCNSESAGRIMDQSLWTDRRKDAVWAQIVRMKIKTQTELLRFEESAAIPMMEACSKDVQHGDISNREAVAAKIYFHELFGEDFIRFGNDDVNAALNYGYAILCSAFARSITMHGYHPGLGIHHCNRYNKNNLASDLMEPFRPFVDRIVYQKQFDVFDWDYRLRLISFLHDMCIYDGMELEIGDAIDAYVIDVMKCMSVPRSVIKEIQIG